ncbi:hypothetical protein DV736_g1918, partial [Chaetothyriales sp. CBS 134916]
MSASETVGSAGSGHPDLHLTAEEKQVFGKLLKEADPDGFGAVSGDIAVKFFERTKLPADVLGQIWQIADTQNRGFLTPAGFGVVLRLIGHAQSGRAPSASLATQPAPLPKFDGQKAGLAAAAAAGPAAVPTAIASPPPSSSPVGPPPIRVPSLGPDKVAEYWQLFDKSGAENGMLSGVVAKQIFERARLPNEVLGRIWALSDTRGRGGLDVTEFVIAMHLLASYKSGQMRGVPSTLPAGLYDAAARRPAARGAAISSRPSSGSPAQPVPLTPQFSGQLAGVRAQSPSARPQLATPLSAQSTGDGWAITPVDKARFDTIFATIDKSGSGYISGEQAVDFFGNARLPEEVLAQIWDLADIDSEGRLTKDEFAVAMYLIRQQHGTKDGRASLPATLPPALMPPSRRKAQLAPSEPTPPIFGKAAVAKARSAADDLFGLDAFGDVPLSTQPQVPQSTGGTDAGPFGNAAAAAPPPPSSPITATTASTTFRPFVPSSSFGQSLQPQSTGSPAPGQSRAGPANDDDLLGDTDPNESSKLTNETSELANLSNQVGSLSKQMTDLQGQRAEAEHELSQQTAQKRAFESRLGQLRSLYENEAKQVKALQAQLQSVRNDSKRLQTDHALEADQAENAALKDKIRQTNQEIDQLRPQLEKLRSDARQQKGLVAINKKQLATNEAERDRLKAEIAAAQKEVEHSQRHVDESGRRAELAKQELEDARSMRTPSAKSAGPPPIVSTASSTSSNPFFRGITSSSSSPPHEAASAHIRNPFDSIFGPSFSSPTAPAPVTSFVGESAPSAPHSALQTTSSTLPVHTSATSRQDSLSPLVKDSSPTSHLSSSITPTPVLPGSAASTVAASISHEDAFAPSAADEEQESIRQTLPTRSTSLATPIVPASTSNDDDFPLSAADEEQESVRQTLPTGPAYSAEEHFGKASAAVSAMPARFPDTSTPQTETTEHGDDPKSLVLGAGTAALAGGAVVAAATSLSRQDNAKAPAESPEDAKDNFDQYFGSAAHKRTPSEQARDFDSAFASIKSSAHANGTAASQEFPDIQELDNDDGDDDSSDDDIREAPLGFEDSFNSPKRSAPPAVGGKGKEPESQDEVASSVPNRLLAPRPEDEAKPSPASSLPDFDATEQQGSPPGYFEAVPDPNPSHFPREYKGLLAERDVPTSAHPAGGESAATSSPPVQAPPPSYGPEVAKQQSHEVGEQRSRSTDHPPAPPPKLSGFDFDSAFTGLGPAQAEDDEDDEDAFRPITSTVPEFDPSFDSPAQSISTLAASSQHFASTHNAGANGSAAPVSKADQFDFDKFQPAPPVAASVAATSRPSEAPKSHDWDDIFAGLSSNGPNAAKADDLDEPSTPVQDPAPVSSEGAVLATAGSIPGLATSSPNATTTAVTEIDTPKAAPRSGVSTSNVPPQLTRAISTTSEHDDPILKRLTAMGWSRSESLAALEKYDYNIDKAADYLTFKSATLADAPSITQLGRSVFTDTFGFSIPTNDLQTYLDEVYTLPAIEADIASPTKHIFPSLADIPNLVELQRLYVRGDSYGRGLGKALAAYAESLARHQLGYSNIWLGVWEGNFVAQRVYETLGYERAGEHEFTMGRCVQIDWIMLKPLD